MRSHSPRTSAAEPRHGGFTAVELVTATALLLLIVAATLSVFLGVQRSENFVSDRAKALDDLRLTMGRISKDVRQAESVAATSTASRLDVVTFVSGNRSTVVYEASGTELTKTVDGGAPVVILENLASTSLFLYTPSVDDAKVVTVTLQVEPPARPETIVQLSSEIRLRNAERAVS